MALHKLDELESRCDKIDVQLQHVIWVKDKALELLDELATASCDIKWCYSAWAEGLGPDPADILARMSHAVSQAQFFVFDHMEETDCD
jgi:hypothetical protein